VNGGSPVAVIIEPWRAHPLAWIHRGEARSTRMNFIIWLVVGGIIG
jgi:hypothetical protein